MGDTEKKAFKDWFDRAAAKSLADQIAGVCTAFDTEAFEQIATGGLDELELSGRVKQISDALRACLPQEVPAALRVLTDSMPPEREGGETVTDGWLQWPLGQFIADHGLPYFEESMRAMIELTKRFSSEFAVRPFVQQMPGPTIARLLELTSHPNADVRRWCSEGVRPLLPWGRKLRALIDDPSPVWPIAEALKDDDEIYVRRSVANLLNDIAKNQPEEVVERCRAWSRDRNPGREWVVRHGLRSLIKGGHAGALEVVGFGKPHKLEATLEIEPRSIEVGEAVSLLAKVTSGSDRSQALVIDYVLTLVRKGGKTGEKVFKWKTAELPAGGQLEIEKRHPMRATSIRALYAGEHRVDLQVNGRRMASAGFLLVGDSPTRR